MGSPSFIQVLNSAVGPGRLVCAFVPLELAYPSCRRMQMIARHALREDLANDIQIVAKQAGVDKIIAHEALVNNFGDIVDAIMDLV